MKLCGLRAGTAMAALDRQTGERPFAQRPPQGDAVEWMCPSSRKTPAEGRKEGRPPQYSCWCLMGRGEQKRGAPRVLVRGHRAVQQLEGVGQREQREILTRDLLGGFSSIHWQENAAQRAWVAPEHRGVC